MGFRFFEKNKMRCLLCAGACLLMMLFPDITVNASKTAIRIWMNAVVPSLLPFMVIAGYIKRTGTKSIAGSPVYPVFMAFLSGYPMGAKLAGEYYRNGFVSEEGLRTLLYYAMITGPAFLLGGIGVTFYHTRMAGYILACSHYAGALTCGVIFGKKGCRSEKASLRAGASAGSFSDTPFTDCILESFRTLGIVLVYIVLFMIGTDFLDSMACFQVLPEEAAAFGKGLLEMTVGCSGIAACSCSMQVKLILSSFIISFGGFSVIGQTMSMLSGCPVTFWNILQIKLCHGMCSAIWTFMICTFVLS